MIVGEKTVHAFLHAYSTVTGRTVSFTSIDPALLEENVERILNAVPPRLRGSVRRLVSGLLRAWKEQPPLESELLQRVIEWYVHESLGQLLQAPSPPPRVQPLDMAELYPVRVHYRTRSAIATGYIFKPTPKEKAKVVSTPEEIAQAVKRMVQDIITAHGLYNYNDEKMEITVGGRTYKALSEPSYAKALALLGEERHARRYMAEKVADAVRRTWRGAHTVLILSSERPLVRALLTPKPHLPPNTRIAVDLAPNPVDTTLAVAVRIAHPDLELFMVGREGYTGEDTVAKVKQTVDAWIESAVREYKGWVVKLYRQTRAYGAQVRPLPFNPDRGRPKYTVKGRWGSMEVTFKDRKYYADIKVEVYTGNLTRNGLIDLLRRRGLNIASKDITMRGSTATIRLNVKSSKPARIIAFANAVKKIVEREAERMRGWRETHPL